MSRPLALPVAFAALLAVAFAFPVPSRAEWPATLLNVPLTTVDGTQELPVAVTDGAGGAIVAWTDYRTGTADLYVQHLTANGDVAWLTDGVAICDTINTQEAPAMVSDGVGGAIVTWQDMRGSYRHIYVQRISADGTPLWTRNGVALCVVPGQQYAPRIVSDGAGGAIVAWFDQRSVTNSDIYAQRITAAGVVQWTVGGKALCTQAADQMSPVLVADGAGGAIVAWEEYRSGLADIYAQRVSDTGTALWAANGVAVCAAAERQYTPRIASDDAGGAIVVWFDQRSGNWDIYAQRISGAGAAQWTTHGVAVCTATANQMSPSLASDGAGGAIVAWGDFRAEGNYGFSDVYAQRVTAAGDVSWTPNGVALCTVPGNQQSTAIVADGSGGAIVAWEDQRNGAGGDIFANHIGSTGAASWATDGVALCDANGAQTSPVLVEDGAGGAIAVWTDARNGLGDIYAQRVWADGSTPVRVALVSAEVDGDRVALTWFAGDAATSGASVYRSEHDGEWIRIGDAVADGAGYLRFVDSPDPALTRIGYRLGLIERGAESAIGETWVERAGMAFALEPLRPNPTTARALRVRFALAGTAPASLELLDVAGRRVFARELGALGAGRHALDLGEGRPLSPGLYLVRLREGGRTKVTRVAVVP